ncbi:stress response protein NST1 [Vespula squamosa]|uniref:Stress response protein NST1 n=1 Tax=Vespula squamosa TaxID=30214 RepID=A0ABD2AF81_VESSQ
MLGQGWILTLVSVGITALAPAPYEMNEESLRSALNAVTRKQISLEPASQEYYNDFRSLKYHGGNVEKMFERERQADRVLPEEDEELEFLPNENGQLEIVGDGFQGVNNKLLEKSVIDYLENAQEQERIPSLFRERERNSNHKRGSATENTNIDGRELVKLFLEELQDDYPYAQTETEENYLNTPIYEKYKSNQGNFYENEGPMSWSELFDKGDLLPGERRRNGEENDFADKNTEQSILYFLPIERRNVNARYPLGREIDKYRNLGKRYPVAKRSPKEFQQVKRQIMDPKIAQDLGALFGTQSTLKTRNYTRPHNHDHDHDHDHDHNHDHDHDHVHNYDHGHENIHVNTSVAPKVIPISKGQKENITKINTSKEKDIEVKKKSTDWSQYFGIDRRKKKTTFLARPGTQDQDDEWMLQRYYEIHNSNGIGGKSVKIFLANMAENLKHPERESEKENDERKEKINQIYEMMNNVGMDLGKAKDQIMNRLAVAYSLEKMRKALNEFRNNLAARKEAQKAAYARNNLTQNFRNDESIQKTEKKQTSFNINIEDALDENKNCPDLKEIERQCKIVDNLTEDNSQMLYLPCVMLQICKACIPNEMDECLMNYAIEVRKVCNNQNEKGALTENEFCVTTALNLMQLQPSIATSLQCRINKESCLHRYYYRYRHRYLRHPQHVNYFSHESYDSPISQPSER